MVDLTASFGPDGFKATPEPIPPMTANTISRSEMYANASAAIAAAGLDVKGEPIFDGKIHRCPERGSKKKGDDAGWAIGFESESGHIHLICGSWRSGMKVKWSSKEESSWTEADRAEINRIKEVAQKERERVHTAAAERAKKIWNEADPGCPFHPYLVAKGIAGQTYGFRVSRDKLIVPVMKDGKIVSLQFIGEDGSKKFLGGGETKGLHCKVDGNPSNGVYVTEGPATAAEINRTTGGVVYVAFSANNLDAVTATACATYKNVVICGDDDAFTQGNPGRTKATAAGNKHGCAVVFPEFTTPKEDLTDFNDMAQIEGVDRVWKILSRGVDAKPIDAFTYPEDFDPALIPERAWILLGLLLRGYLSVGVSPAGVGKSVFALLLAIMVAIGKPLLGRELRERTNVLVINNEDDQDEINRRVAGICQHFGIPFGALTGKLFTQSGYGSPLMVAKQEGFNTVVPTPVKEKMIEFCHEKDIGAVVMDPYVSIHDVPENDNTAIEKVMTVCRAIAKEAKVAILVMHHTGKNHTDYSEAHAGNQDAGRGASSLIGAARINFTLARMSRKTAEELGIEWELGNRLFRFDDGKVNFALKSEKEEWYELVSVHLPNGDSVGVPVPFDMASIAKRKKDEKEEEQTKRNEVKATDVAEIVAKVMTEDKQPQPEVITAYRSRTSKGKSVANDDISMLPVGRSNAIKIMVNRVATKVWRERQGNENRPYYTIHKGAEE